MIGSRELTPNSSVWRGFPIAAARADDRMDQSLGGRLMVRLQTLDLRIGVRVPASQPIILKDLPGFMSRGFVGSVMCHNHRVPRRSASKQPPETESKTYNGRGPRVNGLQQLRGLVRAYFPEQNASV